MHDVQALIFKQDYFRAFLQELNQAVAYQLPQGFALVPLTRELNKALDELEQGDEPFLLEDISSGAHVLAEKISHSTPALLFSTFYFGGDGGQDALVLDNGRLVFSPESNPYNDVWPNSAISRALRFLGVLAENGKDEFDTLGLGNHRTTEKWAIFAKNK